MDWQLFKEIAQGVGVVVALGGSIGVIYKFITDWGGKIVKGLTRFGVQSEIARLEQVINSNTALLQHIKEELDANTRLTLKLELKSLFKNHPECSQVIELTMEKYKSLGGDSYIDTLYDEWKEAYEKPKVRKQLGKGKKK